ncbi:hypothetical protein P3342_001580 [Pyrenophora teres f. teres]|nr:hypothetical protein P3342_001580 [Pyrenophora teres f. teres]
MEHAAEDYYDMPIELLPSANFAGRPMSDISMLDGLWTMIVSSSSEEDGVDEEELQIPSRPSQTQESPKTHKVTIVPPIGDNVDMDRPRLRKKAQTAPPGGFDTTTTIAAPPKPRRAISTRLGYSNTVKRRQPKPYSEIKGSLTARSIEIDMKLGPQKPLPALPAYDEEAISPRTTRPPGSFSSKARVQETLKRKQLGTLDTALADYDFRRVPTSPGSMLATPRELDSVATLDPFAFDAKLESPGRRMSELVGLDGIAMFFDEFGVVAEVTEMTLDKYWLREGCGPTDDIVEDVAADARNSIVSNIEQTGPKGQKVACSDRGSKFSFSSASSAASVPPPEKRKRSRLRDLLSPGLPGSAFLKAPASWGQQTENA